MRGFFVFSTLDWAYLGAMLTAVLLLAQTRFEPGATLRLYYIGQDMTELLPLVPGQTPNVDVRIDQIDIAEGKFPRAADREFKDQFIVEISAEVQASTVGSYSFRLTSDDGSELKINDKVVISHDGVHAATPAEGSVSLQPGWQKLQLRYFENNGGEALKLEWKRPGDSAFSLIQSDSLRVPAGLTRVVSPGTKTVLRPGGPTRPGSGMPLAGLHPGLDLMTIRPDGFEPQVGGMDFLADGRLVLATFKPNQNGQFLPNLRDGKLWLLSGIQGSDRSKIKAKLIAENLKDPLGVCVVGKDIYVSQQFEVTRLRDTNGDDVIDKFETVANGWKSDNYHHFTFGLLHKDGWLYGSLSTSITGGAPGINGPNPANRGTTFRVNPAKYDPKNPMANIEFLSGGHRTPNGIGWGPEGTLLVGENQGSWQPSNKLNVVKKGGFYGHYNNTEFKTNQYPNGGVKGPFDKPEVEQPALYIPQGECGNSPSQPVLIPRGEFKGQVFISDVKYGGLHRAFMEKVKGQWQGGLVHFTQGFESGTNRLVWGPDGALYIGGIGANQTWGWVDPKTGKETYWGLQRVKFNGRKAFEMHRVTAIPGGFQVHFTQPVKPASLTGKESWFVRQWNYAPTIEYGGDKKNTETLRVARVIVSQDRKSAKVFVTGLRRDRIVYLRSKAESSQGKPLWSTECWYTMNELPG